MLRKTLLPLLVFTSIPLFAQTFRTVPHGVVVTAADGTNVRVQVVEDNIFRVSATPDATFPVGPGLEASTESLVRATKCEEDYPDFRLKESKRQVTLQTAGARAVIDRATGRVTFFDGKGKKVLAENVGGRSFAPIEVEGTKGYTVRQTFESLNDNEGLYGLGQHQSDEFNYKRRSEQLFQYNTKVSVPFVVSTEGYGVLWDSYSLCRFGNPDDYKQLSEAFTLYDKEGRAGSLTGTYTDAGGKVMVREEKNLYFEHLMRDDLNHVVNLPQNFNFWNSKVQYEGSIEARQSGTYDFILYYSGYQTVYIDGKVVVPERWRTAWNPNSYKFSVNLKAGVRTPIRIDWQPNGSVAYHGLRVYEPRPLGEKNQMSWWGEMQDMIDYYFIAGGTMDGVIKGYRHLTGRAPVMPRWAMGYWQSREKYNTQDEVLSTLAEYRRRRIPIDNIVIDWLHWPENAWGSHEFDRSRFPAPKAMVDSIHAMNGRVMISVWPKFYATTDHYKEFDSRGWIYQQAIKDGIKDWVGPGYLGSFYDAYSADARRLFWQQIADHYVPLGIDAWWMDASEPNIRDCTDLEYRKRLCGPTALGPSDKYFNAYALMNAEAIYDGQQSIDPSRRVFLLTRSGFAGQQRYSTATWSGDIATRWEDMKAQISAGLNFSMSGIPYWTMDIGGFCVEDRYANAQRAFDRSGRENDDLREWRELNTRWFQFGAFLPLYRAHGQFPLREIYNIAPTKHPAYESMLYYTRLRYRLMPYIYSLSGLTWMDDATIMRPLVMDFSSDRQTFDISDQFLMGPALMACPVTEYEARTRSIYFPAKSIWYDFYSGKAIRGGKRIEVDAPCSRMPLYVRAGSILPVGPDMQWSGESKGERLDIYVYAGADGRFTLYEDDGQTYSYESGAYSLIDFSWSDKKRTLTIASRTGSFPEMLQRRQFNVILIDPSHPQPSAVSNAPEAKLVDYDGRQITIKL